MKLTKITKNSYILEIRDEKLYFNESELYTLNHLTQQEIIKLGMK
jgi:hypothetical protein